MNKLKIPNYRIYGEDDPWAMPETMHCEMIEDRSSIHQWRIKPHRHDQIHQFFYLMEGDVRATIDGTEYFRRAPLFMSIPSLTVHGFVWKNPSKGIVINAYTTEITEALESTPQFAAMILSKATLVSGQDRSKDYEQLGNIFYRCLDEYRGSDVARQLMLKTLLTEIIIGLSRCTSVKKQTGENETTSTDTETICSKLIDLIDQHYVSHREATDYADALGITVSKLNRISRQIVGQSVHELLTQRLILEAKRNIIYTSMSANQIAYALGFNDPAYFSRFFKKNTGFTPGAYRTKGLPG